MKAFGGQVLFLDRAHINTDEIIPARYLTEVNKEALKPHLLEDLKLEGFDPSGEALRRGRVIVARENFGCGSSREHAPWALEVNDITAVIGVSFARIFRQNMFNCGMLAIELPAPLISDVMKLAGRGLVECRIELDAKKLSFTSGLGDSRSCTFSLSPFDEALVRAGGWVEFADSRY
jgi:3-isopropylmalate/(R)-2-methylmalate dehydratase small subunit